MRERPRQYDAYFAELAGIIAAFAPKEARIAEAGVGEATTLAGVLSRMRANAVTPYGFDISWSRIRLGREHLKSKGLPYDGLVVGDLFAAPFADDALDVVYTSHSIEPNGGKEREAVRELYRMTREFLLLFEPAYDLAGSEARKRIEDNGYVTDLMGAVQEEKFEVLEHRLLDSSINPLNPTGVTVIRKKRPKPRPEQAFACPITRAEMRRFADSFFCPDSLLAYPVIGEVPCLRPENAVIATHFLDDPGQQV